MTSTEQRYNVLASSLLFLAYFLSNALKFFTHQGYFQPNLPAATIAGLLVFTVAALGLYYAIWRGRWWAKGLFVTAFLLTFEYASWRAFISLALTSGVSMPALDVLNFALPTILQLAATVLIIISFFKRGPAHSIFAPGE